MGLRKLIPLNEACGAKLMWKLLIGVNSLWSEVLLKKYMLRDDLDLFSSRPTDSLLWKFIIKQKQFVINVTVWNVRDGKVVKFFTDRWLLRNATLKEVCIRPISEEEEKSVVATWTVNGRWDYVRLSEVLPANVLQKLSVLRPPVMDAGNDFLSWKESANGLFTVKSAYEALVKSGGVVGQAEKSLFRKIWRWRGAERIRIFMWIAFCNCLPTNLWRSSWSQVSSVCDCCGSDVESTIHIWRDCVYAQKLWDALIDPGYRLVFYGSSLLEWALLNLNKEVGSTADGYWQQVWGVGIWKLWLWRNDAVFDVNFQKPAEPARNVLACWKSYVQLQEVVVIGSPCFVQPVSWIPPDVGWVKCNVDGAMERIDRRAGCGGVIRNHEGDWVAGFCQELGSCSSYEAEGWAVLKGLQLVWDLGFSKVIIESDAKELVEVLNDANSATHGDGISWQVWQMRKKDWDLCIQFVPRECNMVADFLAKDGISCSVFLDTCPTSLQRRIDQEKLGVNPLC